MPYWPLLAACMIYLVQHTSHPCTSHVSMYDMYAEDPLLLRVKTFAQSGAAGQRAGPEGKQSAGGAPPEDAARIARSHGRRFSAQGGQR